MCNTSKSRITMDLNEDGTITVWSPTGPITCFGESQVLQLVRKIHRGESYHVPRQLPWEYKSETFEEFVDRGGLVTKVDPVSKKPLTKFQADNMSLEDLEL